MKVDRVTLVAEAILAPLLLGVLAHIALGGTDPALGRRMLLYGTSATLFLLGAAALAIVWLGVVTMARRYWAGGLPSTFGARPRRELRGLVAVCLGAMYAVFGSSLSIGAGLALRELVSRPHLWR